ncbi:MAG: metallophosphoesterase family protein [Prosthecobacter sp.]
MKALWTSLSTLGLALLLVAAAPNEKPRGGAGQGGQVEPAVVPPYLFNVWLCRPGAESVTASVLAWEAMDVFITYGDGQKTPAVKLEPGEPRSLVMNGLRPDTGYGYHLTYRRAGGEMTRDVVRTFHTQRRPGSNFTFVMQADSHLDLSTDVRVYQQTLANMLGDRPDFMVDLGDTTMVDKFGSFYTRAESQYQAQRYYLGRIAHSTPVLMVLGNHDGERGDRVGMARWSLNMRHKFFPNPADGNDKHSHYSFEWGNALFVALDPFWATTERGASGWGMTLGDAQYRWLTKVLAGSKAAFKFVFIHHLVGGLGRDVRGGARTAAYAEWGGKNADGSEGFQAHRPGWEMPLHQLFVKHGVSIVFHGHDHLFAKEELDGVIYQEVPQPGHPSGGTRSAEEYGYGGVILGSSGHLRVSVDEQQVKVDYVRSIVPGVTRSSVDNGTVEHSYTLKSSTRGQ